MARKLTVKHFTSPDETRPFPTKGRMDVLKLADGGVVGRAIFEPGWRWSKVMQPMAGTSSCQIAHACYVLSGRMHIKMDDGQEAEMAAGDFAMIPPGHDAWTIGNEVCTLFDYGGATHYAEAQAGAAQGSTAPAPH